MSKNSPSPSPRPLTDFEKILMSFMAVLILGGAALHLSGCQPPPGADIRAATSNDSDEQTDQLKRIADALEELVAKECPK
jgi:hypothetical protein